MSALPPPPTWRDSNPCNRGEVLCGKHQKSTADRSSTEVNFNHVIRGRPGGTMREAETAGQRSGGWLRSASDVASTLCTDAPAVT